ncbi:myo-inositol transporter [Aspergillus nanangensis]|uniref:Myo-inositol transporter n=1 Tax=Aspergillus nanangensis TaxID=2582783 RepID=A0AAD4GUU0_ASPNN|nr:myo-inositol transporter [Aspergillus nanangensis]
MRDVNPASDSDQNSVSSKVDEKNAVAEHVEGSSPLDIDDLDSIEKTESSSGAFLGAITVRRLVVGFGVGSAAIIVPLYIAEIAPTKYRGRMIGLDNISITGGQLISYGISAAFASVPNGWRYIAGLGAVPAIVLCCLLPLCPESPRQLCQNKPEEAAKVIAKIFPNGTPEQVQQKVQHISIHVEQAQDPLGNNSIWWQIKQLYVIPSNFRAMVSACGLMAISQLGGFNSLTYYSSTLFALVGFSNPVAVGTVIAATNFIFTWVNLMLVDRIRRVNRPLRIFAFVEQIISQSTRFVHVIVILKYSYTVHTNLSRQSLADFTKIDLAAANDSLSIRLAHEAPVL